MVTQQAANWSIIILILWMLMGLWMAMGLWMVIQSITGPKQVALLASWADGWLSNLRPLSLRWPRGHETIWNAHPTCFWCDLNQYVVGKDSPTGRYRSPCQVKVSKLYVTTSPSPSPPPVAEYGHLRTDATQIRRESGSGPWLCTCRREREREEKTWT